MEQRTVGLNRICHHGWIWCVALVVLAGCAPGVGAGEFVLMGESATAVGSYDPSTGDVYLDQEFVVMLRSVSADATYTLRGHEVDLESGTATVPRALESGERLTVVAAADGSSTEVQVLLVVDPTIDGTASRPLYGDTASEYGFGDTASEYGF